ncbi:YsnF/AvaK domain-containing protein [Anaeromyxobacter sp. Fw109-5]|uniref:YsnF/AvaK domain-containing protein n=1 Tax=Anaeromyxobacter sp. (strain Fw109-5) TaxID=404589 RepID=UPI0002D6E408|nr:YsnF/AvaK domain-containing protein [Anaeromyxobacter sp. Fw109-5]
MTVFSSDGERLGKVLSCEASTFTIEKGFFFPKDYVASYDDVAAVTGDDIRLAITKETFTRMRESGAYEYGRSTGASSITERTDDIRVPVAEEELDVVKRDREAGEVRLRKDVVTETKHIEVPVTREEVHVERTPLGERRDALPGEKAFEEETVSMPIREEEVEIRKRPVVKEEVRLRKERVTEQRAAEADIRKERVEVEGEHTRGTESDFSRSATRRDPDDPYAVGKTGRDDDLP